MVVTTEKIKNHYDHLTKYYTRFWGNHIHHGYWEDGEDLNRAQLKLIERFALFAGIKPLMRVLDVGCGDGGSAFWLAKSYNVNVPLMQQAYSEKVLGYSMIKGTK